MANKIRVTVWGENVHEKEMPVVAKIYPKGMHGCIADGLKGVCDTAVAASASCRWRERQNR